MAIPWVLFDADGVVQGVRDRWLEQLTAAGGDRGEEFVLAVFAAESACLRGRDFGREMRKGHAKPEPSYFTEVVDRLGVAADEVLFLDDHPANLDGARQAGLNGELFPRGGGVSALAPVLAAYGLSVAP